MKNRQSPLITFLLIIVFLLDHLVSIPIVMADGLSSLPAPGTAVYPTQRFEPPVIRGMMIDPENSFKFDFIVDQGQDDWEPQSLQDEATKLIKYFLASLTIPEEDMWVNLSPYEENRIVADGLGQTEMGRDLLAQDYMLKQLTASLMNPQDRLGREFWDKIYAQAMEKYGSTDIPVNTYNKIWIVPDKAEVYVHENNVFVVDSHLKVMLEKDYLALEINQGRLNHGLGEAGAQAIEKEGPETSALVRELLIPAIEKEVNEGKTFANLRQMANSMILATWYKKNLRQSLLGEIYADKGKIKGVNVDDPEVSRKIYERYIVAFKKGIFDQIKEEYDPVGQQVIQRKYFSGGVKPAYSGVISEADTDLAVLFDLVETSRWTRFTTWLNTQTPNPEIKKRLYRVLMISLIALLGSMEQTNAVTKELADFVSKNEIASGVVVFPQVTTAGGAQKAYDALLNRAVAQNQGFIFFKNGDAFESASEFPFIRQVIQANPKASFDEAAAKLRSYFFNQYAQLKNKKLSESQIRDLARMEIEAFHWIMTIVMRDSGTQYDPVLPAAPKDFTGREAAHSRFIIFNEQAEKVGKGKINTHICVTASEQMVGLAAEIGLRPETVTVVYPIKDDKGNLYPDPKTGIGHENVLIRPLLGAPFLGDQGYTSFDPTDPSYDKMSFSFGVKIPAMRNLSGWEFLVWDKDSVKVQTLEGLARAKAESFNGLTFKDIVSDQDAQLELRQIEKNIGDLNKSKNFQNLEKLSEQVLGLPKKYPLGQRGSLEGNDFRMAVLTNLLNIYTEIYNLAVEALNAGRLDSAKTVYAALAKKIESAFPALKVIKMIRLTHMPPKANAPTAEQLVGKMAELGKQAGAQVAKTVETAKAGSQFQDYKKLEEAANTLTGKLLSNETHKIPALEDVLKTIKSRLEQKDLNTEVAGHYRDLAKAVEDALSFLKGGAKSGAQFDEYKKLEIEVNALTGKLLSNEAHKIQPLEKLRQTIQARLKVPNLDPQVKAHYEKLAQGIDDSLSFLKEGANKKAQFDEYKKLETELNQLAKKLGSNERHKIPRLKQIRDLARQRANDSSNDKEIRGYYLQIVGHAANALGFFGEDKSMLVEANHTLEAKLSITESSQGVERHGGIDFNAHNFYLKQSGDARPFVLNPQSLPSIDIDGLVPVIINSAPVTNLYMILGLPDHPKVHELSLAR